MPSDDVYQPSPSEWVREQVEVYERSGGTEGNTLGKSGMPVLIVTTRGAKTGAVRKTPLMRVEHEGAWALVASMGGAPSHPQWFHNIAARPDEVLVQDGPAPVPVEVHEAEGDERAAWWERCVAAFPPYADYQEKTERRIPVFIATPKV